MIQTYHHGRFEFFVIVIVIAIIALAAFARYSFMAEEAKIMRLKIISHQFLTGAVNVRIQYLIANMNKKEPSLTLNGEVVYFSVGGWPVSTQPSVSSVYQPSDNDCYRLWQLLLQNPSQIVEGKSDASASEYRVYSRANSCRYQYSSGAAYFDYYPLDGRLNFVSKAGNDVNIN